MKPPIPAQSPQGAGEGVQKEELMCTAHLATLALILMVGATSTSQIAGMIQTLRDRWGYWAGAIFVVWVDASGRVWFVCIGQGCNLLSPSQQQREACMLAGQSPGCDAQQWYGGSTQVSNPAVQITP